MNIAYVRSSSLNTYEDCQQRYFLEYILGLPSPSKKKALLGTIIHHVLELLARVKKNKHHLIEDRFCDPAYLLRQCWNRYSREEEIELENTDYKFCQQSIDKVLASPYHPFKLNIIDVEKQFIIPIEHPDFSFEYYDLLNNHLSKGQYELRGTVDLITAIDKDTIEIIDYKSGKRKCWLSGQPKDWTYLSSKDKQLRIYDLAISMLYPQYKYRLMTINFINDGGAFTVSFSDNDRKETLTMLREHLHNVSHNKLPTRIKERKPKQKWKCKHVCPFGKKGNNSNEDICDQIYNYMLHNGMDNTIVKIDKLKQKKKTSVSKTSNRRNVY